MADIRKMTHKSVTAEFTMGEWELLKMGLEAGRNWFQGQGLGTGELETLLKSISPAPAVSRSPLNKKGG